MSTATSEHHGKNYLLTLCIGALGIVYGDIGTSPMYAIRECFQGTHKLPVTELNAFGIVSLIFWALIVVISIKYLVFVMRADNRGEGGILALMALISPRDRSGRRRHKVLVAMALFGAALLYGDGMITPAITVLSAAEGLDVATPIFKPYIIPMTIVILVILFMMQRRGTGGIGAIFGPFMLGWFTLLAAAGAWRISQYPTVLRALSPTYAMHFLMENRWHGFIALGAVFLAVTGGEALYADMGHFGARPIRITWFAVVLPSLLINYFGQTALILQHPETAKDPFFHCFPLWALYPMVAISTVAASIASQAVISGAFSLTRQALQLGYSPRVEIRHTSAREIGQIYIPSINWLLAICTIGLVLGFRSSTALANAYGVAVTTTMVITTVLLFVLARRSWGWSLAKAGLICGILIIPDCFFFVANMIKVHQGGWFPLVVAAVVFTLMVTWHRGRQILNERLAADAFPIREFLASIERHPPIRVPGTAVFMYRRSDATPTALMHNLKHNKVLHKTVVILAIDSEEKPYVPPEERVAFEELGQGFYRVALRFGFVETPDVPQTLREAKLPIDLDPMMVTFFLAHETLIATDRPGMAIWRERLFVGMSRNARSAASFFNLPPGRVVEIGGQIEL